MTSDAITSEPEQGRSKDSPSPSSTNLMDLPDKCLVNIFKFIPLQNLDDIIELCPRWDKLIQENIPVEVHLTDIGFRVAMHYFIGHRDLPKYRIKIVHSRVLDEPLPEFKSPGDLEILEFPTYTEPATLQSLTSKTVNLREIHFGYGSLTGSDLSGVSLHLPNLKLISIVDREIAAKVEKGNYKSTFYKNFIGLLQKRYDSIQELAVTTMATRKQTVDYVTSLLFFIQSHRESLKKVKFNVNTNILIAGDGHQPDEDEPEDIVWLSGTNLNFTQCKVTLQELDLSFGNNFFIGFQEWSELLSTQEQLSHLKIGLEKPLIPSIYEQPINNSASTLVSLQLGVDVFGENENQRTPLDCAIFENCKQLKMLILQGSSQKNLDPVPDLLNVEKLPLTLICLAVENICMETRQVAIITVELFQKGMKLERLALRNIGTTGNFGVKLDMLDTWITARTFQEIIVKGINSGGCQLHQYEHLIKFGVKSPLQKSLFHAYFYPNFMEYRKPAQ